MLLAGAAAGMATAFNAPLTGIILGIEEMSRLFEQRSRVLVLATVITTGLVSLAILGDYTYFGVSKGGIPTAWQWIAVPVSLLVGVYWVVSSAASWWRLPPRLRSVSLPFLRAIRC